MSYKHMICDIDIFVKLQLGSQPVAVVQYTLHTNNTQNDTKTNNTINNTKIFRRVLAVPRLCKLYPGIFLTTEEKLRKTLSQGSRRVPAGTMKINKHTIRIHRHNNKNT